MNETNKTKKMMWYSVVFAAVLLLASMAAFSCRGPAGPQGPPGPQGPASTGTPTTKPPPAVTVNAGPDLTAAPSATISINATAKISDSSNITGYKWTQTAGVKAVVTGDTTATIKVTMGDAAAYKAQLLNGVERLDRFGVQAINPHALSGAEIATFKVTVTTTSGSYTDTLNVNASLPYSINPGLANVAVGEPVLLRGKNQSNYDWTVAGPSGSRVVLTDAATAYPSFTPDLTGKYILTEKSNNTTLTVYAGIWVGAISGQDEKGRPVAASCTTCHDGKTASDNFKDWKNSGHAEIFTQNINDPAGHWSLACAECHSVGYDDNTGNGGFDAAVKDANWTPPSHGDKGLWTQILAKYPEVAKTANIQCENCHGPSNTALHANGKIDAERVSLSSDVCGTCHGEPPRHGRYQQWEESAHANFETASAEGTRASCARCHTAQGFLGWMNQGAANNNDLTKNLQGAKKADGTTADATTAELASIYGITPDTAQPITCAVCHDPHKLGSASSAANNVILRVQGDTPMLPSGFKATNVGDGAMCITCHNSRNGARGDQIPVTAYGGPHAADQGDVMMGQNAYFVTTPDRSAHADIVNTCTNCHMEQSSAPADISMAGQTNHTFTADINICSKCHAKTLSGEAFQQGVKDKIEAWKDVMASYVQKKLPDKMSLKAAIMEEGATTDAFALDKANIVSVTTSDEAVIRQLGFLLKLKAPVTVTYTSAGAKKTASLTSIYVSINNMFASDGKTAVIPLTDNLVKAGWNYMLVINDSSLGVHNPSFIKDVIDSTVKALK